MKTIREIIAAAARDRRAIGHFNISDSTSLRAIAESARELGLPVLIGTSEGERDFLGEKRAAAIVRSCREEFDAPIFLNADHTHSLEKVKRAVEAGYDAILFDGGKLPLEENIRATREVVEYVRAARPEVTVEGELGYIGSASQILTEIPAGAALKPEDLTSPEDARRFVSETEVDFLAPAVGNIHGMFVGGDPRLDTARISAIRAAAGIPLVLHGASGNSDEDIRAAVAGGVAIVHINTEIRKAWREGVERGLAQDRAEVAPYKILGPAASQIKELVTAKLRLFYGI